MTHDQEERLGRLVDKADNFFHAAQLKLPDLMHKEALQSGMKEIRDELRALYVEIFETDPWEGTL